MLDQLKESTLAHLRAYLIIFPEEAQRLSQLASQLQGPGDPFVRSNLRGHVTTSAAVLDASGKNILLIDHAFLQKWLPPGGHYEQEEGESLWDGAQREVAEETGVTGLTLHPWCVQHGVALDIDTHSIPANPKKGEEGHFHHDFRFLAIAPAGVVLTPQLAEVHGARFAPLQELEAQGDRRLNTLARKLRELVTA